MASETLNDNKAPPRAGDQREPDAHGQAAMLLVESLIHGLISRSIISVVDAVEIVEVAAEVKEEVASALGDSIATMQKSLALLEAVARSLRVDVPRT